MHSLVDTHTYIWYNKGKDKLTRARLVIGHTWCAIPDGAPIQIRDDDKGEQRMRKSNEEWITMKRKEREYYGYTKPKKRHWRYNKWIVKWILMLLVGGLAYVIGFLIGFFG